MPSALSENGFQSGMDLVFEKILETGMPLEIEYKGETFVISTVISPDKLANLRPHPDCLRGDPEDIVHMDWTKEWKHDLP
ncbi:MAG: hypothetical protein B6245_16120 [Desulfobacteraceae bacterium 4572_88]|nr:MAG: hypothetical protein B6245_16120 [Desulfobacteraceae bacterium 4572_88]